MWHMCMYDSHVRSVTPGKNSYVTDLKSGPGETPEYFVVAWLEGELLWHEDHIGHMRFILAMDLLSLDMVT